MRRKNVMQTQTKNTKNLNSNIQNFKKSDVITKSLKQLEIPPLTFEMRNWITDWTTINYRNHISKSLPELLFEDADLFFHMYENNFFRGDLEKEAEELYKRARSIKVPSRNGQNMLVQYFSYYDRKSKKEKFSMMKLIPNGPVLGHLNVSTWIDFYVPRSYSDFNKTGYKNFVVALKEILFRNRSLRMNSEDCELFFNRQRYFDLHRMDVVQL
jgi:hypothetical protein